MATLKLTNSEVLSALALVMGVARDAGEWDVTTQSDARTMIRAGLRKAINCGHEWSFMERPFGEPASADYETGTVAVAAGVATLTGGTWPSWAADGVLRVDGRTLYVTARTSDTALAVSHDGLTVAAGTSYALYRWRFAMPDDFGEFLGPVLYQPGGRGCQIRNVPDSEIRLRYAASFRTGQTSMYAVVPGSDDDAAKWYFTFWPTMDANSFVGGQYRAVPEDNLDASDLTTGGDLIQAPQVHAGTWLAAILAAAEEYYHDAPGVHSAKFETLLAASIAHDKRARGAVMPTDSRTDARRLSMLYHEPTYNDLV